MMRLKITGAIWAKIPNDGGICGAEQALAIFSQAIKLPRGYGRE
jgi:hypothetical protein